MKKIFLSAVLIVAGIMVTAQNKPLKGSGIIVTKTFDYKDFDKLMLNDLDGTIEVEAGKPFSITVDIDDNFKSLLNVSSENGGLSVTLKNNLNNRMYIEETNIRIKIAMPVLSVLHHRGNSNLIVNGINGSFFQLKNSGNGDAMLRGNTDKLDIICRGNGTVRAEELIAKEIKISRSGNGNLFVNTDNNFIASTAGNGDIINKGSGKANGNSAVSGNSEIKYPAQSKEVTAIGKTNKIEVVIKNETDELGRLTVKYPVKDSYGIDIKPGETIKESFPAGTKLFKGKQLTTFKKPFYEVTEEACQIVLIKP